MKRDKAEDTAESLQKQMKPRIMKHKPVKKQKEISFHMSESMWKAKQSDMKNK